MSHTLIFDIGKTNKKCFVFDKDLSVVYQDSITFDEIDDDDGFPCDDLQVIEKWIKNKIIDLFSDKQFDIKKINFSTYGASLVHVDENGKPITPLYNYLKPYPDEVLHLFHEKYGVAHTIEKETASPISGMLNSGLQLFWLKNAKPEIYKKTKWSLHFPQYLSYLYTGVAFSDYTSVGCHTSLWDYQKKDYHDWVYQERINEKLAPLISSNVKIEKTFLGKKFAFGVGVHDSSAALYPYISSTKKPFVLLSTGTWNVTLNPFNKEMLTDNELKNDCLNYMKIDGEPVRASRIFLGNEHALQVEKLNRFFGKTSDYYKNIKVDDQLVLEMKTVQENKFCFENVDNQTFMEGLSDLFFFESYEAAYHRLMIELIGLQIKSTEMAIGSLKNYILLIEGGFAKNDLFRALISEKLPVSDLNDFESPIGPELGAAILVNRNEP